MKRNLLLTVILVLVIAVGCGIMMIGDKYEEAQVLNAKLLHQMDSVKSSNAYLKGHSLGLEHINRELESELDSIKKTVPETPWSMFIEKRWNDNEVLVLQKQDKNKIERFVVYTDEEHDVIALISETLQDGQTKPVIKNWQIDERQKYVEISDVYYNLSENKQNYLSAKKTALDIMHSFILDAKNRTALIPSEKDKCEKLFIAFQQSLFKEQPKKIEW